MAEMPTEQVTLDLDEDVLEVAREQTGKSGEPLGKIVSRMARHGHFALKGPVVYPTDFPTLPPRPLERIVTTSFVKRLEYETDIERYLSVFDQDANDPDAAR
jgi:hypothetical protein